MVVECVDYCYWIGECLFDGLVGLLVEEFCVFDEYGFFVVYGIDYGWYVGVVLVVDVYGFLLVEVDIGEVFDECCDEVLV